MFVAHVERKGVWVVHGGMARLAEALCDLAQSRGAVFRFGRRVTRIVVENGRAAGIETDEGERIFSDAIIWNGDVSALAEAAGASDGFGLIRHNIFFSQDYREEFDDISPRQRLPGPPTVYVCAQDREDVDAAPDPSRSERVFCLVNAPARPRGAPLHRARGAIMRASGVSAAPAVRLENRAGPGVDQANNAGRLRTPFPVDAGSAIRQGDVRLEGVIRAGGGSTTRLPGLYLAGGSVHPGPGAPMAALSGRQAALRVMRDLASTRRLIPAATPGGISTRSATIGDMASR